MFAEQIEKLKREYTDKYVLVDASRPELARFRDVVGRVKTVNMSGRALVEFEDYHQNIGWYDIEPAFLKVVDKPPPKPPKMEAKKPAAAKPAPAKAEKPATKPAPPAAKPGKPSVAEILAAARAGKSAAPAQVRPEALAAPPATKMPPAEPPTKPAKVDRSKMSVADIIAAARASGAGGASPADPKAHSAETKTKAVARPVAEEGTAAESAPVSEKPAAADHATVVVERPKRVDKSNMSIDDIIAYCRQHDAKS